MTIRYELGGRVDFTKNTGPLVVINKGPIGGIELYARDEKAGNYIQVFEVAPSIWVDNEIQAWESGNFGDMESARKLGTKAYNWINKGR